MKQKIKLCINAKKKSHVTASFQRVHIQSVMEKILRIWVCVFHSVYNFTSVWFLLEIILCIAITLVCLPYPIDPHKRDYFQNFCSGKLILKVWRKLDKYRARNTSLPQRHLCISLTWSVSSAAQESSKSPSIKRKHYVAKQVHQDGLLFYTKGGRQKALDKKLNKIKRVLFHVPVYTLKYLNYWKISKYLDT